MILLDFEILLGFYVWFVKVIGLNMCNSYNIILINNDSFIEDEEIIWLLSGVVVGFIFWLFVLVMLMLIYGFNMLFFFIYIWFFFLVLMFVVVVVGIVLYLLMDGKLCYSIVFILVIVGIMFGVLFMWLLG